MATLINKNPERRVQYKINANKTEIMFPNLECLSAALLRDLLPSGSTPAGDSAYITDASDLVPVESLKVNIQAAQAGSGDPSPSNVRQITAWDSIKVTVTNGKQSTDPDYVSQDHTIPLGRTVYGGTLVVTTGELTTTWAGITLDGSESWYKSGTLFYTECNDLAKSNKYGSYMLCDKMTLYSNQGNSEFKASDYGITGYYDATNEYPGQNWIYVHVASASTVEDLKSWLSNNPVLVVYTLTTPQTYALTPQQVTLLKGINNVFADAGTVEVKYSADIQGYIDKKIAEVQALVLES